MHRIALACLMSFRKRKGFTLLEILLAFFIFSIVLTTLYTAYSGTFRNIDLAESQSDAYQMARIALGRMIEDLESTYVTPPVEDQESVEESPWSTEFVGESDEIDGRSADTLRFFSTAHLVFDEEDKEVGIARITYSVREGEEEDEAGFDLYRSDRSGLEQGEEEDGGLILCEGVHAIDLIYYDDREKAYESWDSSEMEERGGLPVRISIVLELVNKANPEAPLKFVTGVALPMAKRVYEKAT
jgi:general secretion pathway protein J